METEVYNFIFSDVFKDESRLCRLQRHHVCFIHYVETNCKKFLKNILRYYAYIFHFRALLNWAVL
jgi:hypothetical protein